MKNTFEAFIVDEETSNIQNIDIAYLEQNDVLIKVEYSSLNYKDALAIANPKSKILKKLPFIPGIDFSGIVVKSQTDKFKIGDKVVSTGFGVGEKFFGGYSEYVSAKSSWLSLLPNNISTKEAMLVGTAGFTAMLCVNALLEQNIKPNDGDILISGASGGVGSYSVLMLSQLGFNTVAMSRNKNDEYLLSLGAKSTINTAKFEKSKPLEKQTYAGAIDVIGANTLASMFAYMKYGSSIACCGLAGGYKLNTTIMPFILRGINLLGIDSVYYAIEKRQDTWKQISDFKQNFKLIKQEEITIKNLYEKSKDLLDGKINGRVVVKLS